MTVLLDDRHAPDRDDDDISAPDALAPCASAQPIAVVLEALRRTPKRLSPVWFYDERGSRLFDRICKLPEYYLTRTEIGILEQHAGAMAQAIGPRVCIIEPGSGSSVKTRLLLDALEDPVAYVPVDVAREQLAASAERLRARYPGLVVTPICADFAAPLTLPRIPEASRRVVYFPGSTIGNFGPREARRLLAGFARLAGPGGALLIGVDLRKDPERLVEAYDDDAGVTAAFNLNALAHLNRSLGADFDLSEFRHRAVWNESASRIEMHLVSQREQEVHIDGAIVRFAAAEPLVSEYSHKYTLDGFALLAGQAGWCRRRVWTDEAEDFSVQFFETAPRCE